MYSWMTRSTVFMAGGRNFSISFLAMESKALSGVKRAPPMAWKLRMAMRICFHGGGGS